MKITQLVSIIIVSFYDYKIWRMWIIWITTTYCCHLFLFVWTMICFYDYSLCHQIKLLYLFMVPIIICFVLSIHLWFWHYCQIGFRWYIIDGSVSCVIGHMLLIYAIAFPILLLLFHCRVFTCTVANAIDIILLLPWAKMQINQIHRQPMINHKYWKCCLYCHLVLLMPTI